MVTGPMVTKRQPNRVRVGSGSAAGTANKPNAGANLRDIPVATNQEKIPSLLRHQRHVSYNTRSHSQPPEKHLYFEALPTSSLPSHAVSSAMGAHEDNNEEDEDDSSHEHVESDDTEWQTEHPGRVGKQGRVGGGKSKRFRLTHDQARYLMGEYARQAHPSHAKRIELAKEIPGLNPRQVQVWFQNRRAKFKKLTAEDREQTIRSRAFSENSDISHTLHSPFESNVATSRPLTSIPAQRSPLVYDQVQQDCPRSGKLGTWSTSLPSDVAPRLQTCLDQQSPTSDNTETPLRAYRSYENSLDSSAYSEENVVLAANSSNTFPLQGQAPSKFTNLTLEGIASLNSPLQFSDPAETHYDFHSSPDQHVDFMPSLHLSAQLSPLQVETQPQANEATGLVVQQQDPDYKGIIENIGVAHSRYVQSPTAYLTPIFETMQDFSSLTVEDLLTFPYRPGDIGSYGINMVQAHSLAQSNMLSQGYYDSGHSAAGQMLDVFIPGMVCNPQNQLSQLQGTDVIPIAVPQVDYLVYQQYLGVLPSTRLMSLEKNTITEAMEI